MPTVSKQALVQYSAEQMYQLINQVEYYPLFLPWCSSTQILSQSESDMKARINIAKGPVSKSFITHNKLTPNQKVEMNLVDGPFKKLQGAWKLTPLSQGTDVSLFLEFEFSSKLLGLTFGPIFHQATQTMMNSFLERAQKIYG